MKTMIGSTFRAKEKPVSTSEPNTKRSARVAVGAQSRHQLVHAGEERGAHGRLEQQHAEAELEAEAPAERAPGHPPAVEREGPGEGQHHEQPGGGDGAQARVAHASAPPRQAATSARVAASGSAAPATAEITAKPAAPAARTLAALPASIPPIATTGSGARGAPPRRAARARAHPRASPSSGCRRRDRRPRSRSARRRAAEACSSVWVERPSRRRARAAGGSRAGGRSSWPRCTPSAPAASARSKRSFTKKSAPARAVSARISRPKPAARGRARPWRAAARRRRRRRRPRAPARRARASSAARRRRARADRRGDPPARAGSTPPRQGDPELDDLLAQRVAVDAEHGGRADLVAVGVRAAPPRSAAARRARASAGRRRWSPLRARPRPRRDQAGEAAARRVGADATRNAKSSGVSTSPVESTSARLIAFSSSRTLPGQSWRSRCASVAGARKRGRCPAPPRSARRSARRAARCRRAARAAAGCAAAPRAAGRAGPRGSGPRARRRRGRGGWRRGCARRPAPTRSPPTGVTSPLWSTRSSLACRSIGMSPISSRKSVPPVRLAEAPGARGHRAGEGAALVAEELALEQLARDRGGVDGDEGRVGARARRVDRARHQLLAGPALAGDQHRHVARRDLAHRLEDLEQLGAAADQPVAGRVRRPTSRRSSRTSRSSVARARGLGGSAFTSRS